MAEQSVSLSSGPNDRPAVIVVLDIGKTNIKLGALTLQGGHCLRTLRRANGVETGVLGYPQVDVEGIWQWLLEGLAQLAQHYQIARIGITTHGATVACVNPAQGEEGLVLPILDYEHVLEGNDAYRSLRPDFDETLSPALTAGLNLAAQLHWLAQQFPQLFADCRALLMYPQYWGWRLSGVLAGERTSLGCHTDLWNPSRNDYSSLLDRLGWRALMPEILPTGAVLGALKPALAAQLGIGEDCLVLNGIHDSNASLVPHLQRRQQPFTVISSGTWTVMCGVGGELAHLDRHADMLCNVDAFGAAVPCIRFMGGREWEQLRGQQPGDWQDALAVMAAEVLALPCFAPQGGPFQQRQGRVLGAPEQLSDSERSALAALYCALMTDYCLRLLGQSTALDQGDIIVEGSFASNPLYLQLLASLRPQQRVLQSIDSTGTTLGTALLAGTFTLTDYDQQLLQVPSQPCAQLQDYRQQWLRMIRVD